MIIAFDGIDGAGKTTLLNKVFSKLKINHCIQESSLEQIRLSEGRLTPNLTVNADKPEESCCVHNCVLKTKHTLFEQSLVHFQGSIREVVGKGDDVEWKEIVSDYIKICKKKDHKLFRALFYFPFFYISNLQIKNPKSIILADRYYLTDLAYSLDGKELVDFISDCKNMNEAVQKYINLFKWEDFSFKPEEIKKYIEKNSFSLVQPELIILLDKPVDDCSKDIIERSGSLGGETNIPYYETDIELRKKYKNFKELKNLFTNSKEIEINTELARDENFQTLLEKQIRVMWESKNLNKKYSQAELYRMLEQRDIYNFSSTEPYDLDRYEMSYKDRYLKTTSPTKIIGTLTDYSQATRSWLDQIQRKIQGMLDCELDLLMKDPNRIPLFFEQLKHSIGEIKNYPTEMLKKASSIGTQTHSVIEKILEYIINEKEGLVSEFCKEDTLKIANKIYAEVFNSYGKKWVCDQQWEMVIYFLDYQKNNIKQWVGSEILAVNEVCNIAGRFDAIGLDHENDLVIVDFKTSKDIRKSHFMQIIIYYMIANDYLKQLGEVWRESGDKLSEKDLPKQEKPFSKDNSFELKSLNKFFEFCKKNNLGENYSRLFTHGHLVHLDREKGKAIRYKVSFEELETLKDVDKLDNLFLNSILTGHNLMSNLTDGGQGTNKEGNRVRYGRKR